MINFIKNFVAYNASKLRLKINYPNLRLIDPDWVNSPWTGSFSQANQDLLVYKSFFNGKYDGFFCDIGANHPEIMNNTLFFERLGWKGIAFEPLANKAELWRLQRKATFFNHGLSNANLTGYLNVPSDDKLSLINPTLPSPKMRKEKLVLKPLAAVLRKLHIKNIDFMSIDVEGHEFEVLEGLDFDEVFIGVILIENNKKSTSYGDDKIRKILIDKNFVFWGRIPNLDDIFVNGGLLEK